MKYFDNLQSFISLKLKNVFKKKILIIKIIRKIEIK